MWATLVLEDSFSCLHNKLIEPLNWTVNSARCLSCVPAHKSWFQGLHPQLYGSLTAWLIIICLLWPWATDGRWCPADKSRLLLFKPGFDQSVPQETLTCSLGCWDWAKSGTHPALLWPRWVRDQSFDSCPSQFFRCCRWLRAPCRLQSVGCQFDMHCYALCSRHLSRWLTEAGQSMIWVNHQGLLLPPAWPLHSLDCIIIR